MRDAMKFSDLPACPVVPYQSMIELGGLWDLVAAIDPARVVEIGSLFGGTLWHWLQFPDVREVVSVDLVTDWAPVRADVLAARQLWPTWSDRLRIIEADSHDPATVAQVNAPIDFLFIDGDHVHPMADFDLWAPLVRPGGIVAFHDTVANADRHEPPVVAAVAELKWRYPSIEFFEPDGVGITALML